MTENLAIQIGVGVAMMSLTMFMHAVGLTWLLLLVRANYDRLRLKRSWHVQGLAVLMVLLGVVALHFAEIGVYALLYLQLGVVGTVEAAVYYSGASYATAGIGELVASQEWRILGVIEALNGFLLIGWSTALFVSVLLRIWADETAWLRPGQAPGDRSADPAPEG